MNSLIVSFAAMLAVASAGLHGVSLVGHADHGIVLQGPGSSAAVVGPDGSQIRSLEQGGAVVAHGHPGGIVSAGLAHGYAAHVAAPAYGYAGHIASPAYGYAGHIAAPVAYGYAGLEGQYVPSGLENLYDDGSYKGEHHHEHDGLHYGHYY